jgi:hypothetical protein
MEAYLNRSIKEVIKEFPPVEKILDEYGIGCGPCAVGLCLLMDIVSIHNLPADQEQEMMGRIAQVIHPGQVIQIPRRERKTEVQPKEPKYSPPMKKLVNEHVLIKKWLALIPEILPTLNLESEEDRQLIREGIDFIRSMGQVSPCQGRGHPLQILRPESRYGQGHVRGPQDGPEPRESHRGGRGPKRPGDRCSAPECLPGTPFAAHQEGRPDHAPLDGSATIRLQVGEVFSRFLEVEDRMDSYQQKYEDFISRVEKKYNRKEG